MKLSELEVGAVAVVSGIDGAGSFRRRLMELGIVPGTRVEVRSVAPLGDPLELLVRGSSLSIRRADALTVQVLAPSSEGAGARAPGTPDAELVRTGCARGTP
ncbi:MAG TPA: FeoA family protein [Polyangiaceae bacterium]